MNSEEASLQARILADNAAKELQFEYAKFLQERANNPILADYVRFHADAGSQTEWMPHHWMKQRQHLDSHPARWEWDNFLALAKLNRYRDRIHTECNPEATILRRTGHQSKSVIVDTVEPANEQMLQQLETLINRPLPIGYRTFLSEISNGSAVEEIQVSSGANSEASRFQQIYPIETVCDYLQGDAIQAARRPCELSWNEMMGVNDSDHATRPSLERYSDGDAEDGRFYIGQIPVAEKSSRESNANRDANGFGLPLGMMLIGEIGYDGLIYLALEGEIRGTIWFTTHGSGDMLFSYHTCWIDAPELLLGRGGTKASYVPIDTFSAICELVLDIVPSTD